MVEIYTHIEQTEEGVSTAFGETHKYPSLNKAEAGTNRRLNDSVTSVGLDLVVLGLTGASVYFRSQVSSEAGNAVEKAGEYLPQITLGLYIIRDMYNQVREIKKIKTLRNQLAQLSSDKQSELPTNE